MDLIDNYPFGSDGGYVDFLADGDDVVILDGDFTFEQLIELARELGKDKFVVDVHARPELSSGGDI